MQDKLQQEDKDFFEEAPIEHLIIFDYYDLLKSWDLDIDSTIKKLLLPQSMLGSIENGHRLYKRPRKNIGMTEIINILGFNPIEIKKKRDTLIQEYRECLYDMLHHKKNRLTNRYGNPLFGVNFLENIVIEPDKEAFKGAVIAGRMDSAEWRQQTMDFYKDKKLKIGYGKEYPVNMDKLRELEITEKDLANTKHTLKDIKEYESLGLIISESEIGCPSCQNLYIRHKKGFGICDDAALISIGEFHGRGAMLTAFCMDAVDTYSKYTTSLKRGGLDEYIAKDVVKQWEAKYKEPLITDEECYEVIWKAAKCNFENALTCKPTPFSSSHRRFIEKIDKKATILHHLDFVEKRRENGMELGFERASSFTFYAHMKEILPK